MHKKGERKVLRMSRKAMKIDGHTHTRAHIIEESAENRTRNN